MCAKYIHGCWMLIAALEVTPTNTSKARHKLKRKKEKKKQKGDISGN